jgi:hypothetical protein
MNDLISTTEIFSSNLILLGASTLPIKGVLYVCMALNILTHISAFVLGIICMRNFGKGLKERVFNSRADKWFQNFFSRR